MFAGLCFLVMIVLGMDRGTPMYATAGILLARGSAYGLLWKRNLIEKVREYKTLISDVLEF